MRFSVRRLFSLQYFQLFAVPLILSRLSLFRYTLFFLNWYQNPVRIPRSWIQNGTKILYQPSLNWYHFLTWFAPVFAYFGTKRGFYVGEI